MEPDEASDGQQVHDESQLSDNEDDEPGRVGERPSGKSDCGSVVDGFAGLTLD